MRVFNNGTYTAIDIEGTIVLGTVIDPRVVLLEQRIADYYDVNVTALSDWRFDSEAKIAVCFMLIKYCGYSSSSVARQYRINANFLKVKLTELYIDLLQDVDKRKLFEGFFDNENNTSKAS